MLVKFPLLIEWQNVQASESIPLPILIVAKVPFDVLHLTSPISVYVITSHAL